MSENNFPVAAVRHYEDGTILANQLRYDNAMCHYAFSAECSVKCMFKLTMHSKPERVHDISELFEDIRQYYSTLAVMDAHAGVMFAHRDIPLKLFSGHPTRRYGNNVSYTDRDLEQAQIFSKNLIAEVVDMVLDGKINLSKEP